MCLVSSVPPIPQAVLGSQGYSNSWINAEDECEMRCEGTLLTTYNITGFGSSGARYSISARAAERSISMEREVTRQSTMCTSVEAELQWEIRASKACRVLGVFFLGILIAFPHP